MVKYQFTSQDCENDNNYSEQNKIKEDYEAQQAYVALIEDENSKLKEQLKQLQMENLQLKTTLEPFVSQQNKMDSQKKPSNLFNQIFKHSEEIKPDLTLRSSFEKKNEKQQEQLKKNQEEDELLLFGDPAFNDGEKMVQIKQEEQEQSLNFQDISLNSQKENESSNDDDDDNSETQHINQIE